MTSVFALLTLPQTSAGFSAVRSTVIDNGSSPNREHGSPMKIQILGDHISESNNGDAQFALVRRCIRTILTRNSSETLPATYEGIYTACRSIVTVSNKGEGLHGCLKMELEQCVGRLSKELTETTVEGMEWITHFVRVCQWFEAQVALIQSLLTYLDQVYILNDNNATSIRSSAFALFNDRIFENIHIAERLRAGVKEWVTWERQIRLEHDFRPQIPALISHLLTHKQYSAFEEYYIEITRTFYTAESEERASALKNDAQGFFRHVHLRIEEEIQRSKDVLPVGSWSIVREVTEHTLWDNRLEWLANETVGPFMDSKDITTLATMYSLFSRVGGVNTLCAAFRTHVQSSVQKIVTDTTLDNDMVQRLLDLRALANSTISSAFLESEPATNTNASTSVPPLKHPNQAFDYALSDAFTIGFKARRNKPAEMIAKYLDRTMRKGQGATSDAAFEALLDSVLALYRFTDDKDVFRTFYHRSLAKRLLLEKSASDDFEAAMLKKLKEQYDPEFGMGEDMFKDLALSREAMRDYHSKLAEKSQGHKLSVMVLQRSAWPFTVQKASVDLPQNMQAELTAFGDYYKQNHSGHVLDWDHALGTATLKGWFNASAKELSVSLYQGVVLLLFNESAELSFAEILEHTRMDVGELRRTLQSLACGKKKVLKKSPVGREVENGDVFRFNPDFEDPRAKVHINSIQAKVTPEESKRTQTSIEGDRKHYLDAAIVRIMKARKEMTYEQLKTATIDAVKSHFVPQIDVIKKRIDSLVETDYLERSEHDKNTFKYMA